MDFDYVNARLKQNIFVYIVRFYSVDFDYSNASLKQNIFLYIFRFYCGFLTILMLG